MLRDRSAWILCALVAVCTAGCGQKSYRAETKLTADGRVSRAVYQPAEDTPAAARQANVWQHATYAAEIRPDKWSRSIRDLPDAAPDKEHSYFAAWGEFESPDKLPVYFLKPGPRGLPDGKLLVNYEREDFVFVVEHRWNETLTDVVTLDEMRKSRQQFLEIVIPIIGKCLEVGLGPEYDASGVVDWFRTTGTSWFADATDAFYEAGLRGTLPPHEGWKETMADVCGKYGLKLRDAQGNLLDGDQARAATADFVGAILRDRLRQRTGGPVPQGAIDDVLEWVNLKDHPDAKGPKLARLDGLAQRVIEEQFGSQQQFQDLITPLAARMLGLYRVEILGPPRRFHYELEMPGPIVETNGVLLGNQRVLWKFEAVEAYPMGYSMRCRSLVPQVQLERELLGAEPLTDRDAMLEFAAAVKTDFLLREILRTCVKQKSMAPLVSKRDQIKQEGGDTLTFDTAIRLLKVPTGK